MEGTTRCFTSFSIGFTVLKRARLDFQIKVENDSLNAADKSQLLNTGILILDEVFSKGIIRITESEQPGVAGQLILLQGKIASHKGIGDFY